MDRGQSPTRAPHRSSNSKRAHEEGKIFYSLLQKKSFEKAYRVLETQLSTQLFYSL